MCQKCHPETSAKEVFLEGVKVTGKWPTSSAPVLPDVLTPVPGRWIDQDGWPFATSGSYL